METKTLFEYNRVGISELGNKDQLKEVLNKVWTSLIKKPNSYQYFNSSDLEENEDEETNKKEQRFFKFTDTHITPNNYIGFIQNGDTLIEIYPKIFKTDKEEEITENKKLWLKHIFYWLSYCEWLPARIDNTQQSHSEIDNFPDFLIYYIATLIENVVAEQPYSKYEEVEEILYAPKGRINFTSYINHGLSHGNWHQIDCVYEPFIYNNSVNQIIKYVVKLLDNYTNFEENKKILNNILFILDEVDDRNCTAAEIDKIVISDFFSDYKDILYWCKLIIEQQIFDNKHHTENTFCFLLPMEKIFEGFVAGILKEYLEEKNKGELDKQNNKISLAKIGNENVFQLRTDIEVELNDKTKYIIDTKYKIRKTEKEKDKKQGVSQADMYQMTAYAIRKNVQNFFLFYPKCTGQNGNEPEFIVTDELAGQKEISIKVKNLTIINEDINKIKIELFKDFDSIFPE